MKTNSIWRYKQRVRINREKKKWCGFQLMTQMKLSIYRVLFSFSFIIKLELATEKTCLVLKVFLTRLSVQPPRGILMRKKTSLSSLNPNLSNKSLKHSIMCLNQLSNKKRNQMTSWLTKRRLIPGKDVEVEVAHYTEIQKMVKKQNKLQMPVNLVKTIKVIVFYV